MANPTSRDIPEGTVVKLATNVTGGVVCRHPVKGRGLIYIFSYRETGEAAPDYAGMIRHGVRGFQDHPEQETVESTSGIDIYATAFNDNQSDDETGRLIYWGI